MAFVDRVVPRIVAAISLAVLVSSALVVSQHQACAAANYPDKAVRIVLPFAAGGVADITARIIAEKLGDRLGQRFYVENQPGAGGIAAARTVITSPPDGYTLALLSNGTAISVSLFKKLPFDPLRDFETCFQSGIFRFRFLYRCQLGVQDACRLHRCRKSEARRAKCRDHQYRKHPEPVGRVVQDSGRNRFHHHSLSGDSRGPNIAHARRHCAPDRQLLVDEGQSCRQEIPGAC
jgi:hypothetical protein